LSMAASFLSNLAVTLVIIFKAFLDCSNFL